MSSNVTVYVVITAEDVPKLCGVFGSPARIPEGLQGEDHVTIAAPLNDAMSPRGFVGYVDVFRDANGPVVAEQANPIVPADLAPEIEESTPDA